VIETHYPYWLVFVLMMIGLYTVISHGNLVKKLIGLSLFQAGVFILYISLGKVIGGSAPVLEEGVDSYSHPLPHVLILTAIVVGVATTALGLALAVRIFDAYGTLEEDQMLVDGDGDDPDGDDPDGDDPYGDDPYGDGELGVAP
jgi:multicomponent Na+:H+ antiporter subunit C